MHRTREVASAWEMQAGKYHSKPEFLSFHPLNDSVYGYIFHPSSVNIVVNESV